MSDTIEHTDLPHPGFFIREELEARGWNQRDLAYILDTPEQAVNMIIAGKRGVSPEMAKALGEAFEVHPDFFANLQKAYDMSRARDPDPGIGKRARLQSVYPVREMIKRGWLEDTDAELLEVQVSRFFKVANTNEIPHVLPHAAKKTHYDDVPAAQLAWLFRVRQIAESMPSVPYSEKKLREALVRMKSMLFDPEEARHVPRLLMEAGVRLVIVEALPGSKIDGVCFWLDEKTPVIGLTLLHDRIDNFWFVLRHEIEHVLQRDGMEVEVIDVDIAKSMGSNAPSVSEQERIANEAAADFCIPRKEMTSFIARKNPFFAERDILGFAKRVQVHPGLVVGQVQYATGRWDLLRKHLAKIRQHVLPGAIVDGWGQVASVAL
jgi:HTH-type transcriptional regulator/antitoxin HigA